MSHVTLLLALLYGLPASELDQLAVMPLSGTAADDVRRALDATLVVHVDRVGRHRVISPAEIDAQLGRERLKEVAGCGLDAVTCAAEIAGALGTRFMLSGTAAALGGTFRITLSLTDTREQKVLARGMGVVDDEPANYEEAIDAAVRQLFGLPERIKSELNFGKRLSPPAQVQVAASKALDAQHIRLEQLLEAALDTQERAEATPAEKADAWCALAKAKTGRGVTNPYSAEAKKGCDEWRTFATAWARRASDAKKQYPSLRDYLRLKRKSAEHKQAAVAAFLAAFGDLKVVEVAEIEAAKARLDKTDATLDAPSCGGECVRAGRCVAGDFGCRLPTTDAESAASRLRREELARAWGPLVSRWADIWGRYAVEEAPAYTAPGGCPSGSQTRRTSFRIGELCLVDIEMSIDTRYWGGEGCGNDSSRETLTIPVHEASYISVSHSEANSPPSYGMVFVQFTSEREVVRRVVLSPMGKTYNTVEQSGAAHLLVRAADITRVSSETRAVLTEMSRVCGDGLLR